MKHINKKLKFPSQKVLSTAMIYYHKYSIQNMIIDSIDNLFTCGACVFLSSKSTNRLMSIDRIVCILNEVLNLKRKNNDSQKGLKYTKRAIREKLFCFEYKILCSLNFDMNYELPYNFYNKLQTYLIEHMNVNAENLLQIWCCYINDSFILPINLHFIPDVIAIACACLMGKKLGICINVDKLIQLSHYTISFEMVGHCQRLIELIYDINNKIEKHDESSKKSLNLAKCS